MDTRGKIGMNILMDEWEPTVSQIRDILNDLIELLKNPDLNNVMMGDLAMIYVENKTRAQYQANARKWTKKDAM